MRKLLVLLLAVVIVFCLSSCRENSVIISKTDTTDASGTAIEFSEIACDTAEYENNYSGETKYQYSGVWYRIWGVCGFIFLPGAVIILLEKPWQKKLSLKKKNIKVALFCIIFAVVFGMVYLSRIVFPNISSHSGEFISSYRDSRVAPPLPFTDGYRFSNGNDPKKVFYLDIFSAKNIMDGELQVGATYTVYYDSFTKVIVKIESIEP